MWLWRRDNGLDNFTKFHSSSFSFRNAEFLYLNLKATWRSQSNIPFTFFLEQVNMNGSIGDRRRKKQNHSKCISDWDGKDASPREAVGPETECCLLFTKNRIFGLHNQGSSECDNARKCLPHYCGTLPWHRVPGFKCSVWLCALTYHVCLLTQGVETHQHGGEKQDVKCTTRWALDTKATGFERGFVSVRVGGWVCMCWTLRWPWWPSHPSLFMKTMWTAQESLMESAH